jgi:hypothetical protein
MNLLTAARWAGRILSALLLGLMIFIAVGHIGGHGTCCQMGGHIASPSQPDRLRETLLGCALFTTLAGLAVAWKWEGWGSLLILGGLTGFTVVNGSRTFTCSLFSPFNGFLFAGLLFLFCWCRKRLRSR